MPTSHRLRSAETTVRLVRLAAAMSVVIALVAVVTILKGDLEGRSTALIAVAITLGVCALAGMAVLAWPYIHRRKDKNDPRT